MLDIHFRRAIILIDSKGIPRQKLGNKALKYRALAKSRAIKQQFNRAWK